MAAAETATAPLLLAANDAAPTGGKVVSTADAAGYTYMELSGADGKKFWIAAPTTKVKVGDNVRFNDSMMMTNFASKGLKRTFDTILFVSSTTVVK
jgi:hypothetical protein